MLSYPATRSAYGAQDLPKLAGVLEPQFDIGHFPW
jgi:hypothetical protein